MIKITTTFRSYLGWVLGFIYPLVTRWTWWPEGFLVKGIDYGGDIGRIGYQDFSGSGVVHVVGGMSAFVGAAILGARIGRFDPGTGAAVCIRGHSIPVASCAGCNVVYPWGSCILGITAGINYHIWYWIVLAVRVDDPIDAVAMNLGGGSLGVIAVAFLDRNNGIIFNWNCQSGLRLAWQLAGMAVIMSWTAFWSAASFGIMKWMKILRVPEDIELKGYTNMAMSFKILNDKGPYEHPEIVAEARRNNIAMHEVIKESKIRKNIRSITLHEESSYQHPEWKLPLSHQLNHTINEMGKINLNDNSDFTMVHTRNGSITYELDVCIENPEKKEKLAHNNHVICKEDESESYTYPKDKTTNTRIVSVVKELDYKDSFQNLEIKTFISPDLITRF